ncbi:TIR domain-containing protein [Frankia sp. AvcI1]|uniref:TIR domain-containing protein n=1 Tax=Frankia sp. AvcI1 TaxID=573496 RepID=UPI0021183C46|nr:TIR domain-containing protein [Frankia sp. AvcI1]
MIDRGRSGDGWDFFVSYTAADRAWAEWIAWQLEDHGHRLLIQAWDFVPGSNWTASMADGIEHAVRTIAVLSNSYLRSVYGQAEWQAAIRADPTGLTRKLLPVRIEDCPRPGLLGQIVSVDLFGFEAAAARQVLLDGVGSAIAGRIKPVSAPSFPVGIRTTTPAEPEFPASEPDSEPLPLPSAVRRGRVWEVGEVFQPTGIPEITFVQPKRFVAFGMALRQPGLSIVLEGPSGVGKTTFLRHAIEQDAARLKEPRIFSARVEKDRAEIDAMIGGAGHTGIVAIDDYHRLSANEQGRVVDYLKHLADSGDRTRKLVVVGIPDTARSLVKVSFDVANRIRAFRPGRATDDQINELIDKGERALNISFDDRSAIVRAAAGSLITAQALCWHLLGLARIEETVPEHITIRTDVREARIQVAEELELKYQDAVESFVALDGLAETVCIDLLLGLARSPDGILGLDEHAGTQISAARKVDKVFAKRVGAAMSQNETITRILYHDAVRRRLIADDPQFMFYIRQLDRKQLLRDAGKRPPPARHRAFVCYSHQDVDWLKRLRVHLSPLERDKLLTVWSDEDIHPGDDWRSEIDAALASARHAILLVSADFLASSFIREVELPRLLSAAAEGGCRVLPVLVSASAFTETPELARFQHVNPGGRTLAAMPAEEAEQVLADLARALRTQLHLGTAASRVR